MEIFQGNIYLVVGTSNVAETLDIRSKIHKYNYLSASAINMYGHTFYFYRPNIYHYWELIDERDVNCGNLLKILNPASGHPSYSFDWPKVGSVILIKPVDQSLNSSFLKELSSIGGILSAHAHHLPGGGAMLHGIPKNPEKNIQNSDLNTDSCNHVEGKTPIDGWVICRICGKNLRKVV